MSGIEYLKAFGSGFKEGMTEELSDISNRLVAFGIARWVVFILALIALAQTYGLWTAFTIYIALAVLIGMTEVIAVRDKTFNKQPEVTQPQIVQDRVEDENAVTLTVEETDTNSTVILGLPGEPNIADYHGTHRELEPGESVTLTHDTTTETITIDTDTETETLHASDDTHINVFEHDYILFEYYENAQPTRQHISYGDI